MANTHGARPITAIVGAAGPTGKMLVKACMRRGLPVRAVVHGETGAARVAALGVTDTRIAELADPVAIRAALAGCGTVYMIPPALHAREGELALAALRAAEEAEARRFVYHSVIHPYLPDLEHHMQKARVEAEVRSSALAWTILQPSSYAQVLHAMFCSAPEGDVPIPVSLDSRFAALDMEDLAEIGAKVLDEPDHDRATYELCGPEVSVCDMVRIAADARGITLRPKPVSPITTPIPAVFQSDAYKAKEIRAMWEHYDRHGSRGNSNILTMLLGRLPTSFKAVAERLASGE